MSLCAKKKTSRSATSLPGRATNLPEPLAMPPDAIFTLPGPRNRSSFSRRASGAHVARPPGPL